MKQIEKSYIDISEFSRPGKKREETLAIVMHWTANPNADALQNKEYFDAKKLGMDGYGSAHYVVGQEGDIVQCMPDEEVAWHCGTDRLDPESKKIYTDWARAHFRKYALQPEKTSPNWCTVGIEMCPLDWEGELSFATLDSSAELCAMLCKKYGLTVEDVCTHKMVVGWKDCPKLWADYPEKFQGFLQLVKQKMRSVEKEGKKEEPKAGSFLALLISIFKRLLCGNS